VSLITKVLTLLITSGSIVIGQALLAVIARRLEWPLTSAGLFRQILLNPLFYLCGLIYIVAIIAYVILLRFLPLAQVNISLMVVMIAMTLGYTFYLGQDLTGLQWAGAVVATVGLIALNAR
jgi:hypothetical protein